ncbi:MAG: cupin domain-containing protein [Deinococcota bacterium]
MAELKDPRTQTGTREHLGAMEGYISRFEEMIKQPIPLMFIDSPLPHHQRLNYAVIGDTASENPNFTPMITTPHGFQIGMVKAEPGNGPAYHTHDYIECFVPLTEHKWRFYWGDSEDKVDGETLLGKWDLISLPPKLWRGFEVAEDADGPAWMFAVLEPHDVFAFKDPYWSPYVVSAADRIGYKADESGKLVETPDSFDALGQELIDRIQSTE